MLNFIFCFKVYDKNFVILFDWNGKNREILVFNVYILYVIYIII